MPLPSQPGRTPGPRRRFSVWTVLAPAGALVLFVACFQALGDSCVVKECADTKEAAAETSGPANDLKRGARVKVKTGDTFGSIAVKYNLSQEELAACNPDVDAQTLQPDTYLKVSAADCEGVDRAATGANPDPLAGETSAAATDPANDPTNNGTAAADPSANGGTTTTTTPTTTPQESASAEAGDEG